MAHTILIPKQLLHGIYQITCLPTGKRYVGSTKTMLARWQRHQRDCRSNEHSNHHLQRAWNKYGESSFHFEVLTLCPIGYLIQMEQLYMNHLQPEFNLCPTAGSRIGKKHTEETKAKLSTAFEGNQGKLNTPESIAKRSATLRGRHLSKETREKISAAQRGRKRVPLTPEVRAKISASNRGRQHTLEARAKMSAAKLGKPWSPKRREAFTPTHQSPCPLSS